MGAWDLVEGGAEGYKICIKVDVSGEERFALVEMIVAPNASFEVTKVFFVELFLGEEFVYEIEKRLFGKGEDFSEEGSSIDLYLCYRGMEFQVKKQKFVVLDIWYNFGFISLGAGGLHAEYRGSKKRKCDFFDSYDS